MTHRCAPWLMTSLGLLAAACSDPATTMTPADRAARQQALAAAWDQAGTEPELHPVIIREPPPAPRLRVVGADGVESEVACGTCHATAPPNRATRSSADLDEFHQGLVFQHGDNTCLSCHDPLDYDALRLADGTSIPYAEVMRLCAQCHGTQATSYAHGAHGGMNGHWDRTRGPQLRNHCVHCHDPHAPAFQPMQPTFKPIDRFLLPRATAGARDGTTGGSHR